MLKGNLSEFPLGALIQTLATAERSGALLITPPWIEGKVVLKDGALFAAFAGAREGWEALELLAGLRKAPFAFDAEQALPARANMNLPLEPALARLLQVVDRWHTFQHIPDDWSLGVHLSRKSSELKLTPAMLQVVGLVEGHSISKILELSGASPLDTAAALNELLADGILQLTAPTGMKDEVLVALSFYGKETGVAYLDEELYREWLRALSRPFLVRVRSPRGAEALFEARPRSRIPDRIMLNDKDLRRLKAARGIKLQVRPELRGADE
ncbi:DUF4388 domain-containing protein [Oceanithermus sp.]